jgi:sugar O-acyltransferase (sialic acid O-acetyltransferase NeuD family)
MGTKVLQKSVLLVGGGGHAKVVIDAFLSAGMSIVGIFDHSKSGNLLGVPYVGDYDALLHSSMPCVIAIGNNNTRRELSRKIVHPFTNAIANSALISKFSSVGQGSMILQGVVIQANAVIGQHSIINTNASIDHDCKISNFVHVGPRAVLCGNVSVGEGALVGAGTVVIPGITIGKNAVVGAGSVVISDVPDHCVVVGNPAQVIKTQL